MVWQAIGPRRRRGKQKVVPVVRYGGTRQECRNQILQVRTLAITRTQILLRSRVRAPLLMADGFVDPSQQSPEPGMPAGIPILRTAKPVITQQVDGSIECSRTSPFAKPPNLAIVRQPRQLLVRDGGENALEHVQEEVHGIHPRIQLWKPVKYA